MVGKKCGGSSGYWSEAASLDRRAGWSRTVASSVNVFADFEDDLAAVESTGQLIRHKIYDSEEELPARIVNSDHDLRRHHHHQRQRSSSSGGRLLDPSDGKCAADVTPSRRWNTSLSRRAGRNSTAVGSGGVLAWLNLMADCDVRYKSAKSEAGDVYCSSSRSKRCKYRSLNKNSASSYDNEPVDNNSGECQAVSDGEENLGAAALLPGSDIPVAARSARSDFVDEILEASQRQQQLLLPHQQHLMATVFSCRRPRPKRRGGNSRGGNSNSFRPYIQSEFGEAAVLVPGAAVEPLHLSHAMRTRHHVFHCYEFLLMCRLERDPELWARLCERYGHCDECKGCRAQHSSSADHRQKVR